jgi:hypothetical protein
MKNLFECYDLATVEVCLESFGDSMFKKLMQTDDPELRKSYRILNNWSHDCLINLYAETKKIEADEEKKEKVNKTPLLVDGDTYPSTNEEFRSLLIQYDVQFVSTFSCHHCKAVSGYYVKENATRFFYVRTCSCIETFPPNLEESDLDAIYLDYLSFDKEEKKAFILKLQGIDDLPI